MRGYRLRMDNRLLGIYLNDQLAAGVLWREIARRSARSNSDNDAGAALARVADAIAEDVATFERMMERLGVRRSRVKPLLAMAGERAGRVKPNGHVLSYSPLSRFEELEFVVMGIEGKKVLWQTVRDCAGLAERLPDMDFDGLIERAQRQRDELEPHRRAAGAQAFGRPPIAVPGAHLPRQVATPPAA
jgi:hypothetical protein